VTSTPTGWRKILHLNWALVLLLVAVAGLGFLMLFSVAGGSMTPWVEPQMQRFGLGLTLMFVVGDGADLVLAQPLGLAYGSR
jgi:rod shape determining protein RodA